MLIFKDFQRSSWFKKRSPNRFRLALIYCRLTLSLSRSSDFFRSSHANGSRCSKSAISSALCCLESSNSRISSRERTHVCIRDEQFQTLEATLALKWGLQSAFDEFRVLGMRLQTCQNEFAEISAFRHWKVAVLSVSIEILNSKSG